MSGPELATEQLEEWAPLRRDFVEQRHEFGASEVAPFAHRPRPASSPAGKHDVLGWVGVQ